MPPSGTTPSPTGAGTPDTDSNVNPSMVSLTVGNDDGHDDRLRLQPTGSIGDRVWNDANGNGVQDGGEAGLVGWTVNITGPNGYTSSQTTGANGIYTFNNLLPGSLHGVRHAAGRLHRDLRPRRPGDAELRAADDLAAGEHATDVDFGYRHRPRSATASGTT